MITGMILAAMAGAAPAADSVLGQWHAQTKNALIQIQRCGPSICGTLVTSDGIRANPNLKDSNNKDEAQRGRSLKGITMLQGFTWSDGAWDGGTVYNAEDGRTYKGRVTPVDTDHLKLRGCVFVPLCKTETWTRAR